jgi:hypothetical protein
LKAVRVGVTDARDEIPVVAGRAGDPQRRLRRDHVQPPARIEHVGEGKQISLVRATPVVEHEKTLGLF